MKENYKAWDVNIDDFYKITDEKEKLKFLLSFAVLAPSAHNSQPWSFLIENKSIIVLKNKERLLSYGDSVGRQTLISIGCALENITIASDFYNLKTEIHYLFNNDRIVELKINLLNSYQKDYKNHLIFSILKRCTNRGKFKNNLPQENFIGQIKSISNEKIKISFITDSEQAKKNSIADIVSNAQIDAMENVNFRNELSHYVKSNFTKEKIGMPGFTLGVPAPISLILSKLIMKKNMSRVSKRKDINVLKKYTPIFILINSLGDSEEDWIESGRMLERIWLIAEKNKLSCSPLAAAIEIDNYRKKIQKLLDNNMTPQVFLRMGYPKKQANHSPRLKVKDVLID